MNVYPPKIAARLSQLEHFGRCEAESGAGRSANFECGCVVRFSADINAADRRINGLRYTTNGCGFLVAAAETLVRLFLDRQLSDLHGFDPDEMADTVRLEFGEIPSSRNPCITAAIESLGAAFADHREKVIEEFRGEKPLICTCFGVDEGSIEEFIRVARPKTVDEVTAECRAGGGCGSCTFLIREMIDAGIR